MNIVGHYELKRYLNEFKENSEAYKRGGAKIPNINMNVTPGNGQSVIGEFVTFFLSDNRLRTFHGIDEMIEYSLDGSLKNLQYVFEDIDSKAVYTNEYEGVVVIDYSALAEYTNEYQVDYFVEKLERVSKNATLILYYDDGLGRPIEYIKERVIKCVGRCIDISVLPYTIKEYSQMVIDNIADRGISVEESRSIEEIVSKIITSSSIETAKEAITIADNLVLLADYSGFVPHLDSKMLKNYYGKETKCIRRNKNEK